MSADPLQIAYGLCFVAYAALALWLALPARGQPRFALGATVAPVATGLWALARMPDADFPGETAALGGLDVLRMLAWVGLLAVTYRLGLPAGADRRLRLIGGLALAAASWLLALRIPGVANALPDDFVFISDAYAWLTLPVLGLMLAEALLRQSGARSLWRIKFLCVGVGGMLAYDLFLASEALLFHRWDPLLTEARSVISLLAAPLVAVAAVRNPGLPLELRLSRRAVYHSLVLIGVGLYLLVVAVTGALLRSFGADWGRVLQAGFLFMALAFIFLVYLSTNAQSFTRFHIGRYLFTYRHDYREQWQRFSQALASGDAATGLRERALAAVSAVFGSPVGGLWLRSGDVFHLEASQWLPGGAGDLDARAALVTELERHPDRILELARKVEERPAWLPDWLREWQLGWVVAPLVHRGELIGFMVLVRGWAGRTLHSEDEALLRIVASQTASYLAEERATLALEEANRFHALSRGMAFIAHDLRNATNTMDLMLSNARKHIGDPAFQQDLLLSLRDSVDRMKRLLDKLGDARTRAKPAPVADLVDLVRKAVPARFAPQLSLQVEVADDVPLPVDADPDRLVAIAGHLIQNALEAAGPSGRVTVHVRAEPGTALLEVEDDGPGMPPQFVRERLRRPFGSRKAQGYGIGLYECQSFADEVGGSLEIDSAPGRGTTARLRLPLGPGEPGHA